MPSPFHGCAVAAALWGKLCSTLPIFCSAMAYAQPLHMHPIADLTSNKLSNLCTSQRALPVYALHQFDENTQLLDGVTHALKGTQCSLACLLHAHWSQSALVAICRHITANGIIECHHAFTGACGHGTLPCAQESCLSTQAAASGARPLPNRGLGLAHELASGRLCLSTAPPMHGRCRNLHAHGRAFLNCIL